MKIQFISPQNEEIRHGLENASLIGDVDELRPMLQEDNLLHQSNLHNNLLHIASAYGLTNIVKEILAKNPEYAVGFNARGLTALHLACANEHLSVVREFVQLRNNFGWEICQVRDKDGFLPIHTAARTGNVQILEELLGSTSHVGVRGLTCLGDNILHLAVKSNCFEAIKFLVEKMDGDHEFLNLRDSKGNTILHLAIARKQLQTVKFLLSKNWTDVNAKNNKGCTTLDVLLESPSEHGDLLLGEIIRAVGGEATETTQLVQSLEPNEQTTALETSLFSRLKTLSNNSSLCINWKSIWCLFCGSSQKGPDKFSRESRNTLMVVNTLIATVTFQGGLNPPGGVAQFADKGENFTGFDEKIEVGQALRADWLIRFLFWDIAALLFSLSVILLIICGCPRFKCMISISIIMTWIAVFSTGMAFVSAILQVFPNGSAQLWIMYLFLSWKLIIFALACYMLTRFHISIYRHISRRIINRRAQQEKRTRCFFLFSTHSPLLPVIKVCMVSSCIATGYALFILVRYTVYNFP